MTVNDDFMMVMYEEVNTLATPVNDPEYFPFVIFIFDDTDVAKVPV